MWRLAPSPLSWLLGVHGFSESCHCSSCQCDKLLQLPTLLRILRHPKLLRVLSCGHRCADRGSIAWDLWYFVSSTLNLMHIRCKQLAGGGANGGLPGCWKLRLIAVRCARAPAGGRAGERRQAPAREARQRALGSRLAEAAPPWTSAAAPTQPWSVPCARPAFH